MEEVWDGREVGSLGSLPVLLIPFPTIESQFGPLLPSSEERNNRVFLFFVVVVVFAPSPAFKLKQNRFLPCHSPLLCGLVWKRNLGTINILQRHG